MTDPFDALRAPVVPIDPDPDFAATLRARLERALALPRGVAMTDAATETARTQAEAGATDRTAASATDSAGADSAGVAGAGALTSAGAGAAAPGGAGGSVPGRAGESTPGSVGRVPGARVGAAVPYLVLPAGRGREALDWYVEVLGARLTDDVVVMPDGVLGHAELEVAGGSLFAAEEFPDMGLVAPAPGVVSITLVVTVPDSADVMRRAVDRGATMPRGLADQYGVRTATIVDPFGHRWLLQTPLELVPQVEQPGDVGYAWLTAPDPDRAAAFYSAVLGWDYSPGHAVGGRNVEGQSMPLGIGAGEPGFHLSYAVADVAAAVDRVRSAGGTAAEPEQRPYGPAADCTDDQGVAFSLHAAGARPRVPVNGDRDGDLSYLTLEVVDVERARAFYGAVLGWVFEAGTPQGVVPMTGMHGGNPVHTAVPMWKVADVAAAVERVRAAGGTATDPELRPYGTTSDCTDDQGLRFYLGDS